MRILPKPQTVQSVDPWPDSRPLPWLIDLVEWMRLDGHYCLSERQQILTSLLDHGTLVHAAESGLVDPEDYALLEAIYVSTQPAVSYDDPAWDSADVWETGPPGLPVWTWLTKDEFDALEQEIQAVGLTKLAEATNVDWLKWRKSLGLSDHTRLADLGDPLEDDVPY